MANAETTEIFPCSSEELFKIITDYPNYKEFLSEVKGCKIVKTDGKRKLVEFSVSVVKDFKYSIWLTETPSKEVSWVFESGDFFKTMSGCWKLTDEKGKCKAHYSVEATFSMFVPGPIAKALVSVNLPNMMSSYHKRIEKVYGKR